MVLINGPTSDIYILVSWPIRTAAVFPSGGSIRLRWQFLELISSGGDGMSHKYLSCSIPLDIFSFWSSEVSLCPPPCPSQFLDPVFKKLRFFSFIKTYRHGSNLCPLYRGYEIPRRLSWSALPDVCGVPEVLPEVSSRNCCSRNCAAGSAASGTAAGPTVAGRAPTVLGSEFSCHPSFHQFNRGNGPPRPSASTLSCGPCFLTTAPRRSIAHVHCPSLPAIPTGHSGNW